MAIQIKHQFVSLKGDGGDATQVQPSYWNADHSFSMGTGQLVGRLSAGIGAAEEIPISAFMADLLDTPDLTTLAGLLGLFETGDLKFSLAIADKPGWIKMLGGTGTPPNTIGNAASGAVLRANADTLNLFTLIYTNCSDTIAPVSGGRTGNAVNDFNAGKTIQVPNPVGRTVTGAGTATSGTTARSTGERFGAETHVLSSTEMPSHYHTAAIYDPGHSHSSNITGVGNSTTGGGAFTSGGYGTAVINNNTTGVRVNSSNGFDTTYSSGGNGAHNNLQPSIALTPYVKL